MNNEEKNVTVNNNIVKKKKNILLIICILLQTILSIYFIISIIELRSSEGSFGNLILILVTPVLTLHVWGFYFIATITKNLYKEKKIHAVIFITIVLIFLGRNSIIQRIIPEKYDLSKVFQTIHSDKKDFLIYDNKLYYNVHERSHSDFNNFIDYMFESLFKNDIIQDSINSMDYDGTNNKVLCNNLKNDIYIDDKYFHFIKNNELYYSNVYDSSDKKTNNRKINLSNCKITNLIDDYQFIRNTGDFNTTFMYKNNVGIDSGTSVIKYDILKNKILQKIDIKPYSYSEFIIDYSKFKIYYIDKNHKDDFSYLYMNDKLLFTTKGNNFEVLLLTNNYLFLYDDNNIYKFDLTNNKIISTIDNKFDGIEKIFSDTNDNYFIAHDRMYKYNTNNRIYRYNEETNKFEDILNRTIKNKYRNVYHYGNKLLFDNDHNDILIYDTTLNSIKEYNNVLYNYDNNILYIISNKNNKITIDEIK